MNPLKHGGRDYEIIRDILLMCQNTTMRVNGAWIKVYYIFMLKKYIAFLAMCYNPPLVHDRPLGAPVFVKLAYWRKSSVADVGMTPIFPIPI